MSELGVTVGSRCLTISVSDASWISSWLVTLMTWVTELSSLLGGNDAEARRAPGGAQSRQFKIAGKILRVLPPEPGRFAASRAFPQSQRSTQNPTGCPLMNLRAAETSLQFSQNKLQTRGEKAQKARSKSAQRHSRRPFPGLGFR